MFNYVCFYQNNYVCLHACVQNCTIYDRTIERKERMKILYKIMRIHVYNSESIHESVYLFKKSKCA